jgi:N-acyl-D-amino-acid deacylase
VLAEMRAAKPTYENLYFHAGAEGTLLLAFKNPKLKPLTGKTLAEVAKMRGTEPGDTAIDLVIEDGSRVGVAYFLMSEDNVGRQTALPYVSFGSDESGQAPEGPFLLSNAHPRAYGNFARFLSKYVRDEKRTTPGRRGAQAIGAPRPQPRPPRPRDADGGMYGDVVVFDPAAIQDHATFDKPAQFATGVSEVVGQRQARPGTRRGHRRTARPGRARGAAGQDGRTAAVASRRATGPGDLPFPLCGKGGPAAERSEERPVERASGRQALRSALSKLSR